MERSERTDIKERVRDLERERREMVKHNVTREKC